jgi:hypothetical protein
MVIARISARSGRTVPGTLARAAFGLGAADTGRTAKPPSPDGGGLIGASGTEARPLAALPTEAAPASLTGAASAPSAPLTGAI